MLIYSDTTAKFVDDVRANVITDRMTSAFHARWSHKPGSSEVSSWQNSLSRVRDLIEIADLRDNMIALEYEVPYNQSRIDCLLFGTNTESLGTAVLIELKQWSSVEVTDDEGNFLETFTGGATRRVAHPSQQVEGYENYLKAFVAVFESEPGLDLFSCAYCHNYPHAPGQGLNSSAYDSLVAAYPLYCKGDTQELGNKLKELLSKGDGTEMFNRFMQSPIRPSKKLLEHVNQVINNEAVFSLINDQLVAKNLIWGKVRAWQRKKQKSVVIVHGGPGTGKSVIALNVLAEAAKAKQKVFYGCKSKPFTEGLRKLVGKEAAVLFSNLYRFVPSKVEPDDVDLLLVDEAHRIEKNSNHQYTAAQDRTDMPQVNQLIQCAKTSVFFIDDRQNVRSQEIGHSDLIHEAAKEFDCEVSEVTLQNQFRCMGSNDYLLWLESTLGYDDTGRLLAKDEKFDFQIFDSPTTLYRELAKHEEKKPNSARMVAGFCWPWSKTLDADGELVKDVAIDDFAMPWETHDKIGRPPKGYVKWFEWAYKPEGFKQVGCIYTAQGFEFDYVGVIIGRDLRYNTISDSLVGDISESKDPVLKRGSENFEMHVRNIYRTLLTRGMKGCYVYFVDKDTENYFRDRIES